jgi:hypothetical protein
MTVQCAAWQAQGAARRRNADFVSESVGGADHFGTSGVPLVVSPSRVESFFWTSMIRSALANLSRRLATSFSRSRTLRSWAADVRSHSTPKLSSACFTHSLLDTLLELGLNRFPNFDLSPDCNEVRKR